MDINNKEIVNEGQVVEQTEEFYKNLIKILPDAIFLEKNNKFIFANDQGIKLLGGIHKKDILGKDVAEFLHEKFEKIMKSKVEDKINNEQCCNEEIKEKKIVRLNGEVIDVEVKYIYVSHNKNSDDKIKVVIVRDITERKQYEKALKESEALHRKLTELLPMAVCIYDYDKIEFVNKNCADILGIKDKNELINRSVFEFIYKDNIEVSKEHLKKIENYGEKILPSFQNKAIHVNGNIMDIETWSTTLYDGNKIKILSVFRDITEYLQLEKIKQKSEENRILLEKEREFNKIRTEFFANLSHELKTPLNIILGAQQLLELYLADLDNPEASSKKIKQNLKILKQNCNRLLRLINNIIDITIINLGFFGMNLKNQNIVSIIEDITLSVVDYGKNNDIKIIFDTDIEEKITLCDEDKIERIMLNLLSNAVKFTPKGGSIKVNIHDDGDRIKITVRDNGIGIPKDKTNIIFDRFTQVDKSFTRSTEGSGIGLYLVKALVEMHNGKISVDSEYGKGSEFIIDFPIKIENHKYCANEKNNFNTTLKEDRLKKVEIEFSDIYNT
ncbi:histidine kinase [Clostridium novyi A str. 4552]|uniref:histidine kinase n=1 Tax=Clostridium novyi A str. 4552 TaxID=1444289 RepID=A0A0A0IEK5_CLONO|nr:PAS domain-containing sensor histidine kinase [Clostridium novyi]KGM98035.1 histidine kinase [Clostridium novyi A str. 4552]